LNSTVLLVIKAIRRRLLNRPFSTITLCLAVAVSTAIFVAVILAARASTAAFTDSVGGFDSQELRSYAGEYHIKELAPQARELSGAFDLLPVLKARGHLRGSAIEILGVDLGGLKVKDLVNVVAFSPRFRSKAKDDLVKYSSITLVIDGREVAFSEVLEVPADSPLAATESILVDVFTLQRILGKEGTVSWISLVPRIEGASSAGIKLPKGFFISNIGERAHQAEKLMESFHLNIVVMVAMTLLVAAISVLNALQLHVLSSSSELSTLRALGVSRAGVFGLVLLEGAFIGLVGGILGITCGAPLTGLLSRTFLDTVSSIYLDGQPIGAASSLQDAVVLPLGLLAGLTVCLLGALLPAFQASKCPPAIGQRKAAVGSIQSGSALSLLILGCVLVGAISVFGAWELHAPALAHLASVAIVAATVGASVGALRLVSRLFHFFASRSGSPVARFGFALVESNQNAAGLASMICAAACSLLVGLGVMIGSFRATLSDWVDYTLQADLFARSQEGSLIDQISTIGPDSALQIDNLSSVDEVTTFSRVAVNVGPQQLLFGGTQLSWLVKKGVYRLLRGECSDQEVLSGRAGILSEIASRKLRLAPGESIVILGQRFEVCGIYQDFAAQEGAFLVEQTRFHEVTGANPIFSINVYLKEGSDSLNVRKEVQDILGANNLVLDNAALRDEVFNAFDSTFQITRIIRILLFLMTLGGASIGIAQLVWGRAEEIKVFKMLGATSFQQGSAVLIVGILIALSALLSGLAGGVILALLLLQVINPISFGWSLALVLKLEDFLTPAIALGVGVPLVAIIAGIALRHSCRGSQSVSDD
jgi:putative ABC transport system permease protein